MNDTLYQLATVAIPMIVAIVFHEVAHGRMARLLGDRTAQDGGGSAQSAAPCRSGGHRVSARHAGAGPCAGVRLGQAGAGGRARPAASAPGDDDRRRGRAGDELCPCAVAAVGIGILARIEPGAGLVAQFVFDNLVNFLVINLSLACFNLLPLPPFDGSHIVEGLLPERAANAYARLRPLGFPIILVLLVVLPWLMPAIDPVRALLVPPVSWLGEHYLALASLVAGRPLDA
jgi:Zn-dependent protease